MKHLRISIILSLFVASVFLSSQGRHLLNSWAEETAARQHTMLFLHALDFFANGGGPLGPRENYFAWAAAKRLEEPRSWLSHVLFPKALAYQPLGYWEGPEKRWHHPALLPKQRDKIQPAPDSNPASRGVFSLYNPQIPHHRGSNFAFSGYDFYTLSQNRGSDFVHPSEKIYLAI